jgi:hypothetical protein
MGIILDSIKALLMISTLACLVFLLPAALVMLSLWTSSWIPIVLGVGITIFSAVTIIKKQQKEPEVGDDNKLFNQGLQEKAIGYMLNVKEKKKGQT